MLTEHTWRYEYLWIL